jgi:protein disulfide-isomerase
MNRLIRLVAPAFFALTLASLHGQAEWGTDYAKALAAAEKSGRPVLVNFTGSDWCGFCVRLKDELLVKPAFTRWAADKLVLLELDFPRNKEQPAAEKEQNAELKKKFAVRGYPTLILISAKGEEIERFVGYAPGSSQAHLEKLKAAVAKAARAAAKS